MRPTRRMLWSSSAPRTLPTGAVAFCARSAATTSVTETSYSRSFSLRISTDNSRLSEPPTLTVATPGMPRNLSANWSSAKREISAWLWLDEDRASCMMGCAAGSRRCRIGSRISTGNLKRTDAMALRTSSAATTRFLSKLKMRMSVALPSAEVERSWSTPEMPCSAFSMRLTTSRSTVSGEAPGYGMLTTRTGCSTSGIWLTRSLERANRPSAISATMMTIIATGRLMLNSDRNIAASLGGRSRP